MDPVTILAVATKGITVLNALLEAGKDVAPVVKDLYNTFGNDKQPTDAELTDLEARLDAQLEEFNADLPPENT